MKKILYIQHAGSFGGSVISLLYTIEQLNAKTAFKPTVLLTSDNQELTSFYKKYDIPVINEIKIPTYTYTTHSYNQLWSPVGFIKEIKAWHEILLAYKQTLKAVSEFKPDIVHLNGSVLVGSALAVRKLKIPFIWHVRDQPPQTLLKIRRKIINHLFNKLAYKTIFICQADKKAWGNPKNGLVVYNFVDFNKFSVPPKNDKKPFMKEIEGKYPIILFSGGIGRIKGGVVLFEALGKLKTDFPNLLCLMPGAEYTPSRKLTSRLARFILPLVNKGTPYQDFEYGISKHKLERNVLKLPFTDAIEQLIYISNVAVFPAIRPHFARPVIEALAMGKPVVASNLDGIKELLPNENLGLLVPPNNAESLYQAIKKALNLPIELSEIRITYAKENFDAEKNIDAIIKEYNTLLKTEV